MNKEIAQQWVAALRSGKYKRGTGALKTNDGLHCCLGVLCDLHSATGDGYWTPAASPSDKPYYTTANNHRPDRNYSSHSSAYLTSVVREWAGIGSHCPTVPIEVDGFPPKKISLAEINDEANAEAGFDQIADLIEKHWEIL